MDQLPEEIFITILPYVGGVGFVSLRRTCWRLKMICDDLEMLSRPTLWWRYVLMDFPRPLMNIFNFDQPKEDEIAWKGFYVRLSASRQLIHGASFLDVRLDTGAPCCVSLYGMAFFGVVLKVMCRPCMNDFEIHYTDILADCLTINEEDLHETEQTVRLLVWDKDKILQESYHESKDKEWKRLQYEALLYGATPARLSCIWEDYHINLEYVELDRALVTISRCEEGEVMSFHVCNCINAEVIVFNNNQVVILCKDIIAIAPIDLTARTCKYIKWIALALRSEVRKMVMIGNLLFVLKAWDGLVAAQICYDEKDDVTLTKLSKVKLKRDEEAIGLPIEILDINLHNNLFFALSSDGDLFLCVLEGCNLEDFEKNCLPPFKINIMPESKTMRMAVTSEQGLKVAVLERHYDLEKWFSHVHMIYIRRKKQCHSYTGNQRYLTVVPYKSDML